MPHKVKELDNTHNGDRRSCVTCNPPDQTKWVRADQVWAATLKYGGNSHRGQA